MNNPVLETAPLSGTRKSLYTLLIVLALAAFIVAFILLDNAYFKFADARFPNVGTSNWLANLWGVVSRAHLLVLILPLVFWKPRLFGLQIAKIGQHWQMLAIMLFANCSIVAAYLLLSGGTTPYSGNQWLVTEVLTVPLVEEIFWRGIVFTALLLAFGKLFPENTSTTLAVWLSGLAFGFLHAKNIVAGVPIQFVALQTFNAAIWGVVYGYARARTGSIYPSILLHAAMNLVIILF